MTDLISRADAIEAVIALRHKAELSDYNFALGLAEDAIRHLPSADALHGEWIPCSERLPDVDVEVLTTTDWSEVLIAWYRKDGTWETDEYILANDEILAWMPLPKPYREDGEV